ncbi:MAG: hypothetical protein ACRD29_02770 [Acidimicrobiales bacterium]
MLDQDEPGLVEVIDRLAIVDVGTVEPDPTGPGIEPPRVSVRDLGRMVVEGLGEFVEVNMVRIEHRHLLHRSF